MSKTRMDLPRRQTRETVPACYAPATFAAGQTFSLAPVLFSYTIYFLLSKKNDLNTPIIFSCNSRSKTTNYMALTLAGTSFIEEPTSCWRMREQGLLAVVIVLCFPTWCDTRWNQNMRETSCGGTGLSRLYLRGGGTPASGYTGLPDEDLLDEPRSGKELWDAVYSRAGVITLCNDAGFDSSFVGEHLKVERGGRRVRNFEYGHSCARSAAVAHETITSTRQTSRSTSKNKGTSTPAAASKIFYFEAQVKGGDLPLPGAKNLNLTFPVPDSMKAKIGLDFLHLHNRGTVGCSIGVVDAKSTRGFHSTPSPFNTMVLDHITRHLSQSIV